MKFKKLFPLPIREKIVNVDIATQSFVRYLLNFKEAIEYLREIVIDIEKRIVIIEEKLVELEDRVALLERKVYGGLNNLSNTSFNVGTSVTKITGYYSAINENMIANAGSGYVEILESDYYSKSLALSFNGESNRNYTLYISNTNGASWDRIFPLVVDKDSGVGFVSLSLFGLETVGSRICVGLSSSTSHTISVGTIQLTVKK